MSVPTMPISLMTNVYRRVFPLVYKELKYWKSRAEAIPNKELRNQALSSIEKKTFHCEGGAIMSLIANEYMGDAIKFIVAYQTISDYLDNLCDRSNSLDPDDFSALHESMKDSLLENVFPNNYYRFRKDQEDGNYLNDLVATCRDVLKKVRHYHHIKDYLLELCMYYCDLQVHKHVCKEERVPRLRKMFEDNKNLLPEMEWYEFSACSGSTLGIFSLVAYGFRDDFDKMHAHNIKNGYFPYIQGLHILLDYFIDQEEDRIGGDLNFCYYYKSEQHMFRRMKHFVLEAERHTENLPHKKFHQLINRGLLGIYLSDEKVHEQQTVRKLAKEIIKVGGFHSVFFYINGRMYRKMKKSIFAKILLRAKEKGNQ